MTTTSGNYACDNSSLANFKNWAQAISNALAALGWVQTTDTGQVSWPGLVAMPAGYVYEIWKANDAAAATMPIYMKIEYGNGSTQVALRATIGTGSTGAGVINGITTSSNPWNLFNTFANQGATTYPCYFSGDAGEFRMLMFNNASAVPAIGTLFVIERSKDSTGAVTDDYFTALALSQATTGIGFQQSIKAASAGIRDLGVICPSLTSGSATGTAFGTTAALPVFPMVGKVGNPMLGVMGCASADVAINSTVTVASMYGGTHTYVAFGGGQMSVLMGQRGSNGTPMSGLMRFE